MGTRPAPRAGLTVIAFAAVAVVVAFAPARVLADELVLRNGHTVKGEIESEDERTVKIRVDGGALTFDRTAVKEIRRTPPKDPEPAPAAGKDGKTPAPGGSGSGAKPSDGKSGAGGAGKPAPSNGAAPDGKAPAPGDDEIPPEARDRPPVKMETPAELLAQAETFQVTTWRPVEPVKGPPAPKSMSYRLEHADGRVEHSARAPDGSFDGRVFRVNRLASTELEWSWVPLSWDARGGIWSPEPPEASSCRHAENLVMYIAIRVLGTRTREARECENVRYEMMRRVYLAKTASAAETKELRRQLLEAATKALGSESLGEDFTTIAENDARVVGTTPEARVKAFAASLAAARRLVASQK